MIVNGPTASGKTHLLLRILERDYAGFFDYIVLLCPTYSFNKTYQTWKFRKDPDFLPIQCRQEDVDKWLRFLTLTFADTRCQGAKSNVLFILDDVASSKDVKKRTSELVRLAMSARHLGISVIVLTQQLTSIAKPVRKNIARLISFYEPDEDDLKILISAGRLAQVSKEERDAAIEKLRYNRHAYVEIDFRHPFDYRVKIPSEE